MPNENHGTDLFEIIRTTRSMRRLKPDPVPNELIRKILEAGVCAPSGSDPEHPASSPLMANPMGQCFPPLWWICSGATKIRLFDDVLRKMTDL
jgi:hypothetical protein